MQITQNFHLHDERVEVKFHEVESSKDRICVSLTIGKKGEWEKFTINLFGPKDVLESTFPCPEEDGRDDI